MLYSKFNSSNTFVSLSVTKRIIAIAFTFLFCVQAVFASHFRYGNISWTRSNATPTQVTFKVSQAWRSTFYFSTASSPTVGSVINGGTLNFGDGGTATINLVITSVNVAEDWFYGEFTVNRNYTSSTTDYTANFSNSARIGSLQNNANGAFTVSSIVKGSVAASPSSTVNPISSMPIGQTYATMTLPATDANGLALTYSLTPAGSFGSGSVQPANSSNFFINSSTGVLSFNTAGKTIGQLYNTSITITNSAGATTMVDYIIKMVDNQPPPEFTYGTGNTPNNGYIYNVDPTTGQLCFPVIATNPNTSGGVTPTLTLSGVGLPVGSSFGTQSGTNPASRTFCWTPTSSNLGTNVITFVATNNYGVQTTTSVTIINSVKPVFISPTPGNNSTYCAEPGTAISPFTITANNSDNTNLVSLSLQSTALAGMSFNPVLPTSYSNPVSSILSYTPVASDWGVKQVVIRATDQQNNHTDINYYFVVDHHPVITSSPVLTATVGVPYIYNFTAVDDDTTYGDHIELENANLPSFLTATDLGDGNVTISGVPTTPGTYYIDITLEDSLSHFNGTHCGDATQSYTLVVAAACNTTFSSTNLAICSNQLPYNWNNLTFNAAGTQTDTLVNAGGCDSLATLNLTVNSISSSLTSVSVCSNTLPYVWNGNNYNASGSYTLHFTNSVGCDSAATLNLTAKNTSSSLTIVSVCNNTLPYVWNGNNYNASGSYTLHFTNSVGCDSAATLNLTVNAKPDAGVNHIIICGSNILRDTLSAMPIGGVFTAMSGNPSGMSLSATNNGKAVVSLPAAPAQGTWNFIYNLNGCTDTVAIIIGMNQTPSIIVNGGSNPICGAGFVQLCPTPWGWSNYQWYKNGVAVAAPAGASSCITLDSNNVGTYTLKATNGSGCWSGASNAITVVHNSNCSINTCNYNIPAPCLSNSYLCTGGPGVLTYDLTSVTLTCTKPANTIIEWHTANPANAGNILSNPTAAPIGSYWAVYKDTVNNCYGNNGYATQNVRIDTCSNSVTGGHSGGLESKTLGDVIAVRLYGNAKDSKTEVDGISNGVKFINSGTVVNGINDITLAKLTPAAISNTDAAYVSTPVDLVNFTNAVEVLAVDYTKGGIVKAVSFATKTLGDVYSHTKPICDRLKGAELMEVKNIVVNGFNLMAYKVRQRTGEVEYAVNLSAGTAANRSNISLQSNWFTDSYQQDETLYNFQLWAVNEAMVTAMATDILTKLQANASVNAVNNADLPIAYISKGNRKNTNLHVTINNNTTFTNGYFELKEKANENSQITTRQIAFTVAANGTSNITIPVKDNYEGNIYVYLNNKLTDLVYLADGTWSLDYNKANTTINKFNVLNEGNITSNNTEYRLLRNVEVTATTKDYVTVYKTMLGGGLEQNISNYKSIVFNASAAGASSVKVTLIKKSIANYNEQYSYTQSLDGDKEYAINLNQFKSSKTNASISADDVTAVSFSFNSSRSVATTMTVSLSKARFSTAVATVFDNSLTAINIYPNPATTRFTASFNSNTNQNLVLKVVELATGRVVKTQFVNATKGLNKQNIELSNSTTTGNYIVTLEGDDMKYNVTKITVGK